MEQDIQVHIHAVDFDIIPGCGSNIAQAGDLPKAPCTHCPWTIIASLFYNTAFETFCVIKFGMNIIK